MSICGKCFKENNESSSFCPYCGFDNQKNSSEYPLALPKGSVLEGKYIIGAVLGQGGFGITYLAQDYFLKKLVAIKEYFPEALVTRLDKYNVSVFSVGYSDDFNYGKSCFLEEAKTLALLSDNPNVVSVYSYFEENGTAYYAMEYLEGVSLKDYLKSRGGKISWAETLNLLDPVLGALEAVHSKNIIHRDISPDNIIISNNGVAKIIDFGAARARLENKSQSFDVILKYGFAPYEQYERHGKQGAYTDIYAIGATMYLCITGKIPPDAISRMKEDSLIPPSQLCEDISPLQEKLLLSMLEIQYTDRIQSISALRTAIHKTMFVCPNCSYEMTKQLNFCPKCRTQLIAETEFNRDAAAVVAEYENYPADEDEMLDEALNVSYINSFKVIGVLCIIVAILALIGAPSTNSIPLCVVIAVISALLSLLFFILGLRRGNNNE